MGAWPIILVAFICLIVTLLSLKYGSKNITRSDLLFLTISLACIPLWLFVEDPFWSITLVTFINLVSSFPTIRKSWENPEEELPKTYFINIIRCSLAILALETFSYETVIYPLSMTLNNVAIWLVLVIRKR